MIDTDKDPLKHAEVSAQWHAYRSTALILEIRAAEVLSNLRNQITTTKKDYYLDIYYNYKLTPSEGASTKTPNTQ